VTRGLEDTGLAGVIESPSVKIAMSAISRKVVKRVSLFTVK